MKKFIFSVLIGLIALCGSSSSEAGEYLYKSPNKLDFIKMDKAKKSEKEGGLRHPASLDENQVKGILSSLHFSKNILIRKDITDKAIFSERHVEFLAPYLAEGLKKADENQVVTVSYFTKDSKFLIQNNRITIFRAFVKDDGLHLHFSKIYAKILGDRETKGVHQAATQATAVNVVLEMQPGLSWVTIDPPEVLADLKYDFVAHKAATEVVADEPAKKGKKSKTAKSENVQEAQAAEPAKEAKKPKVPSYDDVSEHGADRESPQHKANIKARLKELEDLKKEDLITDKEYQRKRRDLLQEL